MTDHKPLSDEDLRRLERESNWIGPSELKEQLIAQAREANRLREERDSRNALWDKVDALAANVLVKAEDPAARAKRELGEWLLSEHVDVYQTDASRYPDNKRWACWIRAASGYRECYGPTEHDAITAAIKAARESGR